MTDWQHCLDEGTQHYYYWNTHTNEVTWEIPESYSQHLLRFKEFEEEMKVYEKKMEEFEAEESKRQKDEPCVEALRCRDCVY